MVMLSKQVIYNKIEQGMNWYTGVILSLGSMWDYECRRMQNNN